MGEFCIVLCGLAGWLTVCRITPDKAVTQVAWRPLKGGVAEMAVVSEDCSVRVYGFTL